jgi:hypothetical protein
LKDWALANAKKLFEWIWSSQELALKSQN